MMKVGLIAPVRGLQEIRYDPRWALIDTGADLNYAEHSLLEALGCPVTRQTDVIGATGTIRSTAHDATVLLGFPSPDVSGLHTDVVALQSAHDPDKLYDLVLGNLFLEQGILHMDYVRREFWFDYPTRAERDGYRASRQLATIDQELSQTKLA